MRNPLHRIAILSCWIVASCPFHALAQDPANTPPSFSIDVLSMIFPLLLVIAAGVAALWWIKRRYAGLSGGDALRVRSVLAVGPRERIVLLETEKQVLVIGVCVNSINTLAQWPLREPAGDTVL
jgi:flagellar protein FliO/FliZ